MSQNNYLTLCEVYLKNDGAATLEVSSQNNYLTLCEVYTNSSGKMERVRRRLKITTSLCVRYIYGWMHRYFTRRLSQNNYLTLCEVYLDLDAIIEKTLEVSK